MYLVDYHVHSAVSPDSRATMVEQVTAAIAAGIDELCFTDHIEPHYWDGSPRRADDWGDLLSEFATVSHGYEDKIKVRLGMELGEAPMDFARVEAMLAAAPPLDFIIGSIHRLSKAFDYVDWSTYRPKSPEELDLAMVDYLNVVQVQCDWGQFHVLGHLTLPERHSQRMGMAVDFAPYREQVVEIYKTLIDKGLGIELNITRGDMNCPDQSWLRLYRDLGGQRITIGSDVHQSRHMGQGLAEGQALLKHCGFTHLSTFEKGKEICHKL